MLSSLAHKGKANYFALTVEYKLNINYQIFVMPVEEMINLDRFTKPKSAIISIIMGCRVKEVVLGYQISL